MKVQLISKAAALLLSSIPEGDEIASTVFYIFGDILESIRNEKSLTLSETEIDTLKAYEHLLRSGGYVIDHKEDGLDELMLGVADVLGNLSKSIQNEFFSAVLHGMADAIMDAVIEYRKDQE